MQQQSFDLTRGFLPARDPLIKLPAAFNEWEEIAAYLPKLLVSNQFEKHLERLPEFSVQLLQSEAEYERAMLILSFLGHAYIWGFAEPRDTIPAILAKPWWMVSEVLGRPPILSYASYALHNWRRINANQPIVLGNIVLAQNFLGGIDEEWFVLVHVDIEAKAADALQVLLPAQQTAQEKDAQSLLKDLQQIVSTMRSVCETLERMPERCDPYIYYHRVRPYIHGWKDNPALPNGIVYSGVYDNKPQYFRGETGAQSTIIPSLDAVLGITHENDMLAVYLREMRDYMPPAHRRFLEKLENNSSVREYVISQQKTFPKLKEAYNECIDLMTRFRLTHLRYAAEYIHKQSQSSSANPTAVGTGGTPFMKYLKKHEQETEKFKL